jgi:drug/metabolite transporter (DMT)-like permease
VGRLVSGHHRWVSSLPPLLFAATRYDVGGVVLLGFLVARGAEWRPRTREDGLAILIAGALLIAGNSLLFVGQQSVPSGIASILYGLVPILTTGFAAAFLPAEPISLRRIVGVLVGLVGVGVFASAIAYVIYFTLLERFGPLEINLVSYVVPVFATAGGIVLLGETVSVAMVGGFVLITAEFVVLKARTIAAELGRRN